MLSRNLFIIIALAISSQLWGQKIVVISTSDKAPIEHVAVFTPARDLASITDSLGVIDLNLFPENDTLIFQHPSYKTITMAKGDIPELNQVYMVRKRILIDEYVISASKSRESTLVIPYMVDVLKDDLLSESSGLTAAEILEGTGNIAIQKSQGGGGSPILRGFEANKILLVVDGVRLNNAIYRSGHLQNSITIDNAILERTEVIFGPSSIMYGSDALGGVIHYYTRDPKLGSDSVTHIQLNAGTQYSSAQNGFTGHLDFSTGKKHWASLTSITYKDLGNIRIGRRRNPTFGEWGKIMHYVDQVDGRDSTLVNENPLIQLNTSYSQLDLLQKIRYAPSMYVDWILNMQYSTSSNIDRLDKLNDYEGDNLKYARYDYGPQNRLLLSLKNVLKKDNRLFTNMTTLAAFQRIDEDRYSRKFRNDMLLTQQEDVMVFSLNLDLLKVWSAQHKLHYGVEFNRNLVLSEAHYENINSGEILPAQTRYPEGGSQTWNASAYASYKWILHKKLVLNLGTRYSYGALSSSFTSPMLPYERIDINNGALTASTGLVYSPSDPWQINAILSTGFRNPNVDDYGKVRAKNDYVTVPNPTLSPEYTYNAELGISRYVEGYMKINVVAYYTYLNNAIVRTTYELNGQDSLEYDGDLYEVTTNYNAGRAYIYGASLGITANMNKNIVLRGTLNYTKGYNLSDDVPLGHIPPIFGRTSFAYRKNNFFLDTYVVYQGWKYDDDFSPYGEDNDAEAMMFGFPSWWTANIKTGYRLKGNLQLMFAIENLFDQFYKPFASGVSGPGRNFILSARFRL